MRLYELMQHKITVISGHFGSGKTNVALNLALDAADAGEQVSIADLDIVNPYFRTADSEAFLRARGIKPLVPQYANTNVEIPTLPEALGEIFYGGRRAVVDVGGDPEGAAARGCGLPRRSDRAGGPAVAAGAPCPGGERDKRQINKKERFGAQWI